jgi:hypothetical protein
MLAWFGRKSFVFREMSRQFSFNAFAQITASGSLSRYSRRPHKIYKLSAIYGKTIHAVEIADDLRAVFYVEGNVILSVDIGDHRIYRG